MKKRPRSCGAFFDFLVDLFLRNLPLGRGILNVTF